MIGTIAAFTAETAIIRSVGLSIVRRLEAVAQKSFLTTDAWQKIFKLI